MAGGWEDLPNQNGVIGGHGGIRGIRWEIGGEWWSLGQAEEGAWMLGREMGTGDLRSCIGGMRRGNFGDRQKLAWKHNFQSWSIGQSQSFH